MYTSDVNTYFFKMSDKNNSLDKRFKIDSFIIIEDKYIYIYIQDARFNNKVPHQDPKPGPRKKNPKQLNYRITLSSWVLNSNGRSLRIKLHVKKIKNYKAYCYAL